MTKVFIPQITRRLHPVRGLVPIHDFSAADKFGYPVTILDMDDKPASELPILIPRIKEILSSFKKDDWLLATGDPALIAVCAVIISKAHGQLNMLRWDRRYSAYSQLKVEF